MTSLVCAMRTRRTSPSEICVRNVLRSNGAMRNGGTGWQKIDGGRRKAKICCYNLVTPKANKIVPAGLFRQLCVLTRVPAHL